MLMLTDFSAHRPYVWPTLAPELNEVHRLGPGGADVTEGSLSRERDDYDWSADRVRWTVRESNFCQPGSYVEVRVRPGTKGGSKLHVDWNRRGVGIKGMILITFVALTRGAIIRRKVFQRALNRALRQLRNG
jgi:hypothetical protein